MIFQCEGVFGKYNGLHHILLSCKILQTNINLEGGMSGDQIVLPQWIFWLWDDLKIKASLKKSLTMASRWAAKLELRLRVLAKGWQPQSSFQKLTLWPSPMHHLEFSKIQILYCSILKKKCGMAFNWSSLWASSTP